MLSRLCFISFILGLVFTQENAEIPRRKRTSNSSEGSSSRQKTNDQLNSDMGKDEIADWISELQADEDEQFGIINRITESTKLKEDFTWENMYNDANNIDSGEEHSTYIREHCKGYLIQKEIRKSQDRSRCHGCYLKNYQITKNSVHANQITKTRVDTYCDLCNKPYCLSCFAVHTEPKPILEYCKGNIIQKDIKQSSRSRCKGCYNKNYQKSKNLEETKNALNARLKTKTRVDTYCEYCDKPYCESCFPTHLPTRKDKYKGIIKTEKP